MRRVAPALAVLALAAAAMCQSGQRAESEYYVRAYALHYGIPVEFVRALIEEESGWQVCARSAKGALGVMQLMPETGRMFELRNPCDPQENISAGIRYLAHLSSLFRGDLRLVAAAYQAGERRVSERGLNYANPEVIAYVKRIRARVNRASGLRVAESVKGREACR